jgi:sugar lactone lactonase YvrE
MRAVPFGCSALRAVSDPDDELGESPCWDDRSGRLLWVDIGRGVVSSLELATGCRQDAEPRIPVSYVGIGDHGVVVAGGTAVGVLDDAGRWAPIAEVLPPASGTVLNDGKVDDEGRLWIGSYAPDGSTSAGLFVLEEDGAPRSVMHGMSASNGIAWTDDAMHTVDTPTGEITRWEFDALRGIPHSPRRFAVIEEGAGLPDGMAADTDGGVWVALFGGGAIRRYDRHGAMSAQIPLPVTHPTSIAFGGPERSTLFITTSRHRLDAAARALQPCAGAVLAIDTPFRGRPIASARLRG